MINDEISLGAVRHKVILPANAGETAKTSRTAAHSWASIYMC